MDVLIMDFNRSQWSLYVLTLPSYFLRQWTILSLSIPMSTTNFILFYFCSFLTLTILLDKSLQENKEILMFCAKSVKPFISRSTFLQWINLFSSSLAYIYIYMSETFLLYLYIHLTDTFLVVLLKMQEHSSCICN